MKRTVPFLLFFLILAVACAPVPSISSTPTVVPVGPDSAPYPLSMDSSSDGIQQAMLLSATRWRTIVLDGTLTQFAAEEVKHIELFVAFRREFTEGFGIECGFIGPAEDIGAAVRAHGELGLAIFVLGIEWATQRHYLESVRDDQTLDAQFKSLLRHHWL